MKTMIFLEEKEEDHLQVMTESFEIGIDEVGKGSIFGPVFSAATVISKENGLILKNLGLNDSKKLSKKKRELLFPHILSLCEDWGIGQSSVREIDKYGIRSSTELSMVRAIDKLRSKPLKIIVDGNLSLRLWKGSQENIIQGDSKFPSIAAASIIAKVIRDSLMNRFEYKFNGYSLSRNKGYGTKQHFLALHQYGLTSMHRNTFLRKLNII